MRNQNDTPFELSALLLLLLPLLFTFQKLVELAVLGDRSHQLAAGMQTAARGAIYGRKPAKVTPPE